MPVRDEPGLNRLYSVGHSTRTTEELLSLLAEHSIVHLVDVRRFPGSRRHPHFGRDALSGSLAEAGVGYRHAPELGGHRKPLPDSPNSGWRNDSFRGYADHMATREFADGLGELMREAGNRRSVILCAEAVPWRCHRNLLADALVTRDWEVLHIIGPGTVRRHELNPMAVRHPGGIVYPGGPATGSDGQLDLLG